MLDILDKRACDRFIVKKVLKNYLNKQITIECDLGRNKKEKYVAMIKKLYNSIFIIEIKDTDELKSFTYADIITKTIKIYDK